MSQRNVDPTAVKFFHPTPRAEEFTIISDLERLITHWDTYEKRSRLCGGMDCRLCQIGVSKLARWYLMMVDRRGRDWLLELRGRHMETFATQEHPWGCEVRVRRNGIAFNSPVEVVVVGQREVRPRDISRLVARFCLAADLNPVAVELTPSMMGQLAGDLVEGEAVPNPPGYEDFA